MENLLTVVIIGYLLGSLSPGYFFGRIVKGIDIRNLKNKNTGAANTYYLVGPVYGIITGVFDALKALISYFIAVNGLTVLNVAPLKPDWAILAGIAAVAGHIWPFYLQFRGGRGVASLAGLSVIVVLYTASWYALAFIGGVIIYDLIFNQVKFEAPFRKILKLAGIIFPLATLFVSTPSVLSTVVILLFIFVLFDILRFLMPRLNVSYLKISTVSKLKEKRFFSGYTLFLTSTYVILKLFPSEITVFAMLAFIFADLLAPAGKEAFLPIPLVKEKTIGGAIIVVTVAMLVGIFLRSLTPLDLSVKMMLTGAIVAAILDQLSFLVDDNILVPLGTAAILALLF